jgi:hypothetical protein
MAQYAIPQRSDWIKMDNIARTFIFRLLEAYDTAAPGDRGIIQEHVNMLFDDLDIDPEMTLTEFQDRLNG